MRRLSLGMLAGLALTWSCGARATPIAEYQDDTSWKAAAAGYSVHAYTGGVTITIYTTTIQLNYPEEGDPLTVVGTDVESHHQFGLAEITGDFTYWDVCGVVVGCQLSAISEIDITFDDPIFGIEFVSAVGTLFDDVGILIEPGDFPIYAQTGEPFGLVGDIKFFELDFIDTAFPDSPNDLNLTNILVATAPEPASLSLLSGGLLLLSWGKYRKRHVERT